MSLYTVRFIATIAAGVQVTYTVAPGKRGIVTSVVSTNATSAAKAVEVRAAGIYIFTDTVPAFASKTFVGFRVVVYAGETIQCIHQASGQHTHVNGYLFDDPASGAAEDTSLAVAPRMAYQVPEPEPRA